jgi:anaerobic magnesium-protoporphyrin IX monomethyl ester cyclase
MIVEFIRPKSTSPQWGFQQPDLGLAYCISYLESKGVQTRYHDLAEAARCPTPPLESWVVLAASDYTMNNDGSPTIAEARAILSGIGRSKGHRTILVGPYARHGLKSIPDAIAIDRESDPERPLHRIVSGEDLDQINGIWRSYDEFQGPGDLLEDLDLLPFPDRDAMTGSDAYPEGYEFNITNRGCPFQCSFCYHWRGKKVRYRSVEKVVEELLLQQARGATFIDFKDDTFSVSVRYTRELCESMIQAGFRLPWRCHTRTDRVDLDLLKTMKAAGCESLGLGVESFSQAVLDSVDKGLDVESVKRAFALAEEAGLRTFAYIVFGFPAETKATMKETLRNCLEINPDQIQFAFATPFPGTPYYAQMHDRGFRDSDDLSDFNILREAPVGSEHLTPEQVLKFGHHAKRRFIGKRIRGELSRIVRLDKPRRRIKKIRGHLRTLRSPVSWVL